MGVTLTKLQETQIPAVIDKETFLKLTEPVCQFAPQAYDAMADQNGQVSKSRFLEVAKSTDAYVSFDWGIDCSGRDNYARVKRFNKFLVAKGLVTYLDEGQVVNMGVEAKVKEHMARAQCVVLCMTERYLNKLSLPSRNNQAKLEFYEAMKTKPLRRIIPVVMDTGAFSIPSIITDEYPDFKVKSHIDLTDFELNPQFVRDLYAYIAQSINPIREGGNFLYERFLFGTTVEGRHQQWLLQHVHSFTHAKAVECAKLLADGKIESTSKLANVLQHHKGYLQQFGIAGDDEEAIRLALRADLKSNFDSTNARRIVEIMKVEDEKAAKKLKQDKMKAQESHDICMINNELQAMSKQDILSHNLREDIHILENERKFHERRAKLLETIERQHDKYVTLLDGFKFALQQEKAAAEDAARVQRFQDIAALMDPAAACVMLQQLFIKLDLETKHFKDSGDVKLDFFDDEVYFDTILRDESGAGRQFNPSVKQQRVQNLIARAASADVADDFSSSTMGGTEAIGVAMSADDEEVEEGRRCQGDMGQQGLSDMAAFADRNAMVLGYYDTDESGDGVAEWLPHVRSGVRGLGQDGELSRAGMGDSRSDSMDNYDIDSHFTLHSHHNDYKRLIHLLQEACYICRAIICICTDSVTNVNAFIDNGIVSLLCSMLSYTYLFSCSFESDFMPAQFRLLTMPIESLQAVRYLVNCGVGRRRKSPKVGVLFVEAGVLELCIETIKFHLNSEEVIISCLEVITSLVNIPELTTDVLTRFMKDVHNLILLVVLIEKYLHDELLLQSFIVGIVTQLIRLGKYDDLLRAYRVNLMFPMFEEVVARANYSDIDQCVRICTCIDNLWYDPLYAFNQYITAEHVPERSTYCEYMKRNVDHSVIIHFLANFLRKNGKSDEAVLAAAVTLGNVVFLSDVNKIESYNEGIPGMLMAVLWHRVNRLDDLLKARRECIAAAKASIFVSASTSASVARSVSPGVAVVAGGSTSSQVQFNRISRATTATSTTSTAAAAASTTTAAGAGAAAASAAESHGAGSTRRSRGLPSTDGSEPKHSTQQRPEQQQGQQGKEKEHLYNDDLLDITREVISELLITAGNLIVLPPPVPLNQPAPSRKVRSTAQTPEPSFAVAVAVAPDTSVHRYSEYHHGHENRRGGRSRGGGDVSPNSFPQSRGILSPPSSRSGTRSGSSPKGVSAASPLSRGASRGANRGRNSSPGHRRAVMFADELDPESPLLEQHSVGGGGGGGVDHEPRFGAGEAAAAVDVHADDYDEYRHRPRQKLLFPMPMPLTAGTSTTAEGREENSKNSRLAGAAGGWIEEDGAHANSQHEDLTYVAEPDAEESGGTKMDSSGTTGRIHYASFVDEGCENKDGNLPDIEQQQPRRHDLLRDNAVVFYVRKGMSELLLRLLTHHQHDTYLMRGVLVFLNKFVHRGRYISCKRLVTLRVCEKFAQLMCRCRYDSQLYLLCLMSLVGLACSHPYLVGGGQQLIAAHKAAKAAATRKCQNGQKDLERNRSSAAPVAGAGAGEGDGDDSHSSDICRVLCETVRTHCPHPAGPRKWMHFSFPYVCNACLLHCAAVYCLTTETAARDNTGYKNAGACSTLHREAYNRFRMSNFYSVLLRPPKVHSQTLNLDMVPNAMTDEAMLLAGGEAVGKGEEGINALPGGNALSVRLSRSSGGSIDFSRTASRIRSSSGRVGAADGRAVSQTISRTIRRSFSSPFSFDFDIAAADMPGVDLVTAAADGDPKAYEAGMNALMLAVMYNTKQQQQQGAAMGRRSFSAIIPPLMQHTPVILPSTAVNPAHFGTPMHTMNHAAVQAAASAMAAVEAGPSAGQALQHGDDCMLATGIYHNPLYMHHSAQASRDNVAHAASLAAASAASGVDDGGDRTGPGRRVRINDDATLVLASGDRAAAAAPRSHSRLCDGYEGTKRNIEYCATLSRDEKDHIMSNLFKMFHIDILHNT